MEKQNPSETVDGQPYGHHDASRPPAKLPHPPAGEPNEGGDDIDLYLRGLARPGAAAEREDVAAGAV